MTQEVSDPSVGAAQSATDSAFAAEVRPPHPSFPTDVPSPPCADGRRHVDETDLTVFPLSLGISSLGSCADDGERSSILDRFIELGGNVIDAADAQETSQAEKFVGRWMRKRGNRDGVIISTSIGRRHGHDGLAPRAVTAAVTASLSALNVDHLDILFFDGDDVTVPIEDSLAAADELVSCGKVRYLAAAGYSASRLMEARILSAHGFAKFVAIRTPYSLLERRGFEGDLALVAHAQRLAVLPCAPLSSVFMSADTRLHRPGSYAPIGSPRARRVAHRSARVRAALDVIAGQHGFSVSSVALAWLLAKPNILMPVMSVRDPDRLAGLMVAPNIRLTRSHVLDLDRVSA